MSPDDKLQSYLRLFAKEETFCFKPAALEDLGSSKGKIIPLHPRRRAANASPPDQVRWRGWDKISSR
jgi:hypothetical protein